MPKVVTKEMTPDDVDISAFVTLGMSPFMAGQDIIANQNRFVRNECIFVRHFVRLQDVTADSDARHAKTEQDIYEHLEQHNIALKKLVSGSAYETSVMPTGTTDILSVRADPEFLALEKLHQETRTRLDILSRQVTESSGLIQRALTELAQRLDQITGSRAPI